MLCDPRLLMIGSKTNHNNMLYFHKAVGCEKELREVVNNIFNFKMPLLSNQSYQCFNY